jgi:PHD/YefM family antitoxin component YafN of YafNO toxin-antitoxin module
MLYFRVAARISTMEVRERLGDYLNRVALRHDQFIIERKGKALAAMVPVDKLIELERAARERLLERLRPRRVSISQRETDKLADEAKHRTRKRKRR